MSWRAWTSGTGTEATKAKGGDRSPPRSDERETAYFFFAAFFFGAAFFLAGIAFIPPFQLQVAQLRSHCRAKGK
jgi:hypothetical protein